MKLHLAHAEGRNLFSGYGPGYVAINGVRHERSLIVLPDRILDWEPASFEELTEAAFADLARLPLEVLLLGTGARFCFFNDTATTEIYTAGIGFEVMDTGAPAELTTYSCLRIAAWPRHC